MMILNIFHFDFIAKCHIFNCIVLLFEAIKLFYEVFRSLASLRMTERERLRMTA